jgi:peroxiredoxin
MSEKTRRSAGKSERQSAAGHARPAGAKARRKTTARLTWALATVAVAAIVSALVLGTRNTSNAGTASRAAGTPSKASLAALPVGPAVGDRAPDFTLPDLQGKQVSLHQFLGHPVLLHFWAVDCTTCQAEQADYLQAIHELGAHAPTILAVDAWGESADYVAPYVAKHRLPGAVLIDPPHSVFDGLYQGQGTPTTVYIDREGVIVASVIGQETRAQILSNARLIGA